jgi:hypothetical protein
MYRIPRRRSTMEAKQRLPVLWSHSVLTGKSRASPTEMPPLQSLQQVGGLSGPCVLHSNLIAIARSCGAQSPLLPGPSRGKLTRPRLPKKPGEALAALAIRRLRISILRTWLHISTAHHASDPFIDTLNRQSKPHPPPKMDYVQQRVAQAASNTDASSK